MTERRLCIVQVVRLFTGFSFTADPHARAAQSSGRLSEKVRPFALPTPCARFMSVHHSSATANAHLVQTGDALHRVLYRIAERATAGLSFFEFLQATHQLLGELVYARNFYVCLYNPDNQTLDFPYYVDEKDGDTMQCNGVPLRRGLTEYVLRTERPQLIDTARFRELQASGEITEATGDLSFSAWLGVPMQLRGVTGGALVVQCYEAGNPYTDSDADVLSFVANQFGSAIERHQALDALRQSEARYRSVFENLGVGVVVIQNERMVFVNPAMSRIVGRSQAFLLSQPFLACVHPDDVPLARERQALRLSGAGVAPIDGIRVLTDAAEVRHLEVSGAVIEWEHAPATLLFAVDATQRIQAESSQREALYRQKELNDLKARFVAMASHEFRTPLSSISSSADLLLHYADRLAPEERVEALQKIHGAVGRMTRMLENLLQVEQAEAGPLQFNPSPHPVAALCRSVVEEVHSAIRQRSADHAVQLQLNLPADDVKHLLDEGLWRQILGNLVSNALKYSHQGGVVEVTVSSERHHLCLVVSDEGIGIDEQDMPKLFEPFHRGRNVGQISGTGLGLTIVRQAVAAHQGQIDVNSAKAQGTCFTVRVAAPRVEQ